MRRHLQGANPIYSDTFPDSWIRIPDGAFLSVDPTVPVAITNSSVFFANWMHVLWWLPALKVNKEKTLREIRVGRPLSLDRDYRSLCVPPWAGFF